MPEFVIGVDEAGRGPLAGPVAVGVVRAPSGFDMKAAFPGINDSKKLTPQKREELFELLREQAERGVLAYTVLFSSAAVIDRAGLTRAVRRCVFAGVRKLAPEPEGVHVLLDGLLKAPPAYSQQTIIHGDALEPAISLASVAAKVTRDRLMCKLSKRYPQYGFELHKGYGTAAHLAAIRRYGLCAIHRRSFAIAGEYLAIGEVHVV